MENLESYSGSTLSPTELNQLQAALGARFPLAKGVLGSQLGFFVRRNLMNPDLKGRFGGLKEFIVKYFPRQIVWQGRQGLDDLYDICFASEGSALGTWHRVPPEPSAALWSAATNPAVYVQFAWSHKEVALLQAPVGITLNDDSVAVEKLTNTDYQSIATEFVSSIDRVDADDRARALSVSRSAAEFTKMMREKGILAKWEEFRIDQASRRFTQRLAAAGASSLIADQWLSILRASQQKARFQRSKKPITVPSPRGFQSTSILQQFGGEIPQSRVIAIKAMEFLSDSELYNLSLPLGSVMRAIESLTGRP
jgi:hypothetical protein